MSRKPDPVSLLLEKLKAADFYQLEEAVDVIASLVPLEPPPEHIKRDPRRGDDLLGTLSPDLQKNVRDSVARASDTILDKVFEARESLADLAAMIQRADLHLQWVLANRPTQI